MGESVELSKDQSRYLLQVHRMVKGDSLAVFDGVSREYLAEIVDDSKRAALKIKSLLREEQVCEYHLTLAQALPKQGKMETIIQKACELGVSRIVPFRSRYSQVKLDKKQIAKKLERWNKISEEACRQCRRISLPQISQLVNFEDLFAEDNEVWLAYEGNECIPIKTAVKENSNKNITLVIGSEGGFSEEEIALANSRKAKTVSLGPRVLRTETAGQVILSIVQYALGDLSGENMPFIYKG